ncbi:MAG: NAD+ synthase [candidate division Zixibacteria bacterium]
MIDIKGSVEILTEFIRDYTNEVGINRLIIGLSGGVDSSVSAALGSKAVGAENILGVIMPYKRSSPESKNDAINLANKLGISFEKVDISPMVDAYFGNNDVSSLRRGNKCARERMSVLFDISARDNRLVLGTSNKTEICLGYATWYGDNACSLNPLGGLYKGEVWAMAEYLEVPPEIIKKKPTADLWPGQTDEDELGLTYKKADELLYLLIEKEVRDLNQLKETGTADEVIKLVINRINKYSFKRGLPPVNLLGRNPIPTEILLD